MNNKLVSIIDVGSSSIKMTIYEIKKNEYNILEELRHPVRIGKDSFYNGKITRNTINESIHILKKFKKLCSEYNVQEIKAFASTAIRESTNNDVFLDNIFTSTGLDVQILTLSKESEYIYNAFYDIPINLGKNEKYWAIIKIGTADVEIIIVEDDCIIYSRSMPLGVLKIKQIFIKEFFSEENFDNFLEVMIKHELQNLKNQMPNVQISKVFGVGFDIDELVNTLKKEIDNEQKITNKTIGKLCTKMQSLSEEEIYHKFKIPYDLSETFFPAVLIFNKIINFLKCEDICIPKITLRDGIFKSLYYYPHQNSKLYFEKLEKQLKSNAIIFGKSLNFDEKHALKVMDLSIKIFDQTKDIHNLGKTERYYLIVSALLHDIGAALSYRSHHKHSLYIIKAHDFYSFNEDEVNIIANIARYHRKSAPRKSHPLFMELSRKARVTVLKLASILRIADSLDNTHLQLIKDIKLIKDENEIIIEAAVEKQFFSEVYSFKYKKQLFEDFFGININLRIIEKNEK